MSYWILTYRYPGEYINGDTCFNPALTGYYRNCCNRLPDNTLVSVTLDSYVDKLKADFFSTGCGAFFASKEFCDILRLYNAKIQLIAAQVYYFNGEIVEKQYYLLHSLQKQDCFDYRESDYGGKALVLKYLINEGKPRRMITSIRRLCIDKDKAQEQDYFFLENVSCLDPVISERLKLALVEANLTVNLLLAEEIREEWISQEKSAVKSDIENHNTGDNDKRKDSMPEIRSLRIEMIEEIKGFQEKGACYLGIEQTLPPREKVAIINSYIRDLKSNNGQLDDQAIIIGIGLLLGEQYVSQFGWHWGKVIWDHDEANSSVCVLAPDNSISINPIWWVSNTLITEQETNFLLNFNMVAANRAPVAGPNEAIGFH